MTATTKIVGYIHDFLPWGANPVPFPDDRSPDFGNLFRNMLPQAQIARTLGTNGLPQIGATDNLIRTVGSGTIDYPYETFQYWFQADGRNALVAGLKEITLTDVAGVYTLAHGEYYPIDGEGLGNDFGDHNVNFTFASNIQGFYYTAGQYVKIHTGGATEDAWVFVNGQRLTEIYGQDDAEQTASLDGRGLVEGQYYPIRFFFAWRDPGAAPKLGIKLNFALEEESVVAISHWVLGSGTMVPAAGAYAPGSQTVTATPTDGYVLTSLTANGVAITSGAAYDFQAHTVLAALFTFTSDNTSACTRDNIIAAALRKCQILAEGELPTTDQITTGASALERFMKHMQADTEFRWLFLDRTETIVSGTQTYTLTGSDDVLDIYNLFLRDASGQDIPLRTVDSNWYDQTLMSKANSDAQPAVAVVAFNRAYSTNTASVAVTIYPKPSAAYTLHYKAMTKFYNLVGGASELIQDEIWCDVVVYGLAARLADEYLGVERSAYLEQKFEKLKDEAKRKSTASRDTMMVYSV